jgi:hypothetical protein
MQCVPQVAAKIGFELGMKKPSTKFRRAMSSSRRQPLSAGTGVGGPGDHAPPAMVPKDEYKKRKELDEARKVSDLLKPFRTTMRGHSQSLFLGWYGSC